MAVFDSPTLVRPTPRRASPSPSTSSPATEDQDSTPGEAKASSKGSSPNRTRSILNLTSSTLFGIYAPSDEPSTPWGNGAQTPSWRPSLDDERPPTTAALSQPTLPKTPSRHNRYTRDSVPSIVRRTILLFVLGVAYGIIIVHLHDDQHLAPVKVEGIERYSIWYLSTWGLAGVLLGTLLPWVDTLWEENVGDHDCHPPAEEKKHRAITASMDASEDGRPSPLTRDESHVDCRQLPGSLFLIW